MHHSRFVEWRPATAEDILAIIKADHLDRAAMDPVLELEEGETISFDMTVKDWRLACDLLPLRQLAPVLNEWFHVHFKRSEWKSVLLPEEKRTLRDLCSFIAQQATLPSVKVGRIMGKACVEGSTFMAIKQVLQEAGVPASEIRPSTSLEPYTREYLKAFLIDLKRLAPGALPPPVMVMNLGYRLSYILYVIGGIGLVASFMKSLFGFLVLAIIIGMLVAMISSLFPPSQVRFGNLQTFRDLTFAFVNELNNKNS